MQIERIMVTGAGGFLGSHISRYFGKIGHKIYAIGHHSHPSPWLDSTDGHYHMTLPDDSLIELIRKLQPSILIHCAGSSSVADSLRNPYNDFRKTVEITAFLLDVVRREAPECKIIFPSSAAVYGNPMKLPISESTPCAPISPYGFHKMFSEQLIQEYAHLYGVSSVILRIFSAYGEGLTKQVIYDLCRKFADQTTDEVEVYGTGNESRDFIHVADICKAIEYILKPEVTGIFNLASGKQTKVCELVDIMGSHFSSDKSVRYTGETRKGDPVNWEADMKKMTTMGFEISVPLEDGLHQFCEWYKEQK